MINTFHFFNCLVHILKISEHSVLFLWGNIYSEYSHHPQNPIVLLQSSPVSSLSLHATLPLVGVYLDLFRMGGRMDGRVKTITRSSRYVLIIHLFY